MSRWTRITSRIALALGVALALVAIACGDAGGGAENVEVRLTEYSFDSTVTTFETGTSYEFALVNDGTAEHEWLIMPRGELDHDQALVEVEEDDLQPGDRHTVSVTFDEPGEYEFACHLPGHYEAGMVLPITVR